MKYFRNTQQIRCIGKQIKSKVYNDKVAAIKRLNYENKLLFGKLVTSSKTKTELLERIKLKKPISKTHLILDKVDVKQKKTSIDRLELHNDILDEKSKKIDDVRIEETKSVNIKQKINVKNCGNSIKNKYSTAIKKSNKHSNIARVVAKEEFLPSKISQNNFSFDSDVCNFIRTDENFSENESNAMQKSNLSEKFSCPNFNNTIAGTLNEKNADESLLLFPLFNEEKKKYTPKEKYLLNLLPAQSFNSYPSVSVILRETISASSELNLKRWKENLIAELGAKEFEMFQKLRMLSGSLFRQQILKLLKGTPEGKLIIEPVMKNYWKSMLQIFPFFSDVKDTGKIVSHSKLKYKGSIDCLVEFQGKLMLVNWKKAKQFVPSVETTFDIPLQIAAYVGAINYDDNFPFQVEDALLVVCYLDGSKADVFHLNSEKCLYYWNLWLERLYKYQIKIKEQRLPQITKNFRSSSFSSLNQKIIEKKMTEKMQISSQEGEKSQEKIISNIKTNLILKQSDPMMKTDKQNRILQSESCLRFPLYNEEKSSYIPGEIISIDSQNQLPFNSYPAVTVILGETKSETAKFLLERWKRNLIAQLGIEGFENYQKNLLQMGTDFHKLVQEYLSGVSERNLKIEKELVGCWKSLKPVFPLITGVKLTERKVIHEKLKYKGVIDCIAEYKDKLVIIDWKKSDRIKPSINMTYDAPVQVAAYIGAINFDSNYQFKVEECLLVICYTDGTKADVFHINKETCFKYWKLWLERLDKFQKLSKENSLRIEY